MTYATRCETTNHLTHLMPRIISQDPVENQFAKYRLGLGHMRFTTASLSHMHQRLGTAGLISAVGHKAQDKRNAGAASEEMESLCDGIIAIESTIAAFHERRISYKALFAKPTVTIAADGTVGISFGYK